MLHPIRRNCGYHPKLSIHNRIPHTSVGYLCYEALAVNSAIPLLQLATRIGDGSQGCYLNGLVEVGLAPTTLDNISSELLASTPPYY